VGNRNLKKILLAKQAIGRIRNFDLRELGCEASRWMELAQDCVQLGFFQVVSAEIPATATTVLFTYFSNVY
jgi:hypothetical protein